MPKGPQGQKRPADVIGAAVRVARIATGEETEDTPLAKNALAVERGRRGGSVGGRARATKLTPDQRAEVARIAAQTRWKKSS